MRYEMQHKDNPEYWDREKKRAWTEKGEREIDKLQRMTGYAVSKGLSRRMVFGGRRCLRDV